MPMLKGYSKDTISENIAREIRKGKPRTVASAAAFKSARDSWRRKFKGKPYPVYLKPKKKTANSPKAPKMAHGYYLVTVQTDVGDTGYFGETSFFTEPREGVLYPNRKAAEAAIVEHKFKQMYPRYKFKAEPYPGKSAGG
jgi:hypothetical protein